MKIPKADIELRQSDKEKVIKNKFLARHKPKRKVAIKKTHKGYNLKSRTKNRKKKKIGKKFVKI